MNIGAFFKKIFKSESVINSELIPQRKQIKDVKTGELVRIKWYRLAAGIGELKCMNNDPDTKKIALRVKWSNQIPPNPEYEIVIFKYSDTELEDFTLLNQIEFPAVSDGIYSHINALEEIINDSLLKEEYEKITEIKNKLKELLEK